MKNKNLSTLFALSSSLFAFTGCAADAGFEGENLDLADEAATLDEASDSAARLALRPARAALKLTRFEAAGWVDADPRAVPGHFRSELLKIVGANVPTSFEVGTSFNGTLHHSIFIDVYSPNQQIISKVYDARFTIGEDNAIAIEGEGFEASIEDYVMNFSADGVDVVAPMEHPQSGWAPDVNPEIFITDEFNLPYGLSDLRGLTTYTRRGVVRHSLSVDGDPALGQDGGFTIRCQDPSNIGSENKCWLSLRGLRVVHRANGRQTHEMELIGVRAMQFMAAFPGTSSVKRLQLDRNLSSVCGAYQGETRCLFQQVVPDTRN